MVVKTAINDVLKGSLFTGTLGKLYIKQEQI